MPQVIEFYGREDIIKTEHEWKFQTTAPIYPGEYLIGLGIGGPDEFTFESLPIIVELGLPDVTLNPDAEYIINYDDAIELDLVGETGDGVSPKIVGTFEFQTDYGEWVEVRDPGSAIFLIRPRHSGRYRVSAWAEHHPGFDSLLVASAEFDVVIAEDKPPSRRAIVALNEPASFNAFHIYQADEHLTASIAADFEIFTRLEVELHQREFGDRKTESGRFEVTTTPIKTWVFGASVDFDLPDDLDPGDYALYWKSYRTSTDDGSEITWRDTLVFTLLPAAEDISISVNGGQPVPLNGLVEIAVAAPDILKHDDEWLDLEVAFLGGQYLGHDLRPRIDFSRWPPGQRVFGADRTTQTRFDFPGRYEVQLMYGNRRVLARQRFDVNVQPQPGTISLLTPNPTTKTPLEFTIALPEQFTANKGYENFKLVLWRRGDLLPSGFARVAAKYWDKRLDGSGKLAFAHLPADVFEARLVQRSACFLELCPKILVDRIEFEVQEHDGRGPLLFQIGVDDLADTSRGPYYVAIAASDVETTEIEEKGTYQPPPYLALEAASYPREPQPGQPVTVGFRIENRSAFVAAGVIIDIGLADPRTGREPDDLEIVNEFCQDIGAGNFRCILGDVNPGDVADLIFHAKTPKFGAFAWSANFFSAGDLGGRIEQSGMLGARGPPVIMDVVVSDQQNRVEDFVPSYPYPFGPNSRGSQSRYLLVVGYNLPGAPVDQIKLPDNDDITYGFLAYPDTENAFYKKFFARRWAQFYETDDEAAALARAKADGYDSVLVRADLKPGVLPSLRTITLSDRRDISVQGRWSLEFGDLSVQTSFVRLLNDGGLDLLNQAYLPERIHFAVETNFRVPIEEIPVVIDAENLGGGGPNQIRMVARRSDIAGGRIYLTGPIDLHHKSDSALLTGGTAIAVLPDDDSPPLIQAFVDPAFIFKDFRVPVLPRVASAGVATSPTVGDYSWLWLDALIRAAACHDDDVVARTQVVLVIGCSTSDLDT